MTDFFNSTNEYSEPYRNASCGFILILPNCFSLDPITVVSVTKTEHRVAHMLTKAANALPQTLYTPVTRRPCLLSLVIGRASLSLRRRSSSFDEDVCVFWSPLSHLLRQVEKVLSGRFVVDRFSLRHRCAQFRCVSWIHELCVGLSLIGYLSLVKLPD